MALAIGTKTNNLTNAGAGLTVTFAHTQNTGADGYLFVVTGITSGADGITGVTYNGVSMTLVDTRLTTSTSISIKTWRLAAPATGANNVVVTFSSGPYNPLSTEAISFTGSAGEGNFGFADTAATPNANASVTVSANSVIVGVGVAGTAGTNVTLDGSSRTIDWNNNANNYIFGGVSALGLTAGSKTSSLNALANAAVVLIEVKESGGGGGGGSRNTQVVWL